MIETLLPFNLNITPFRCCLMVTLIIYPFDCRNSENSTETKQDEEL